MTDIDAKAREIVRNAGGICLVGSGVTSHEHTFCDCTVEKLIAAALLSVRNEALEEAAKVADRLADYDTRKALGGASVITASQIATAIRDLKDDAAT